MKYVPPESGTRPMLMNAGTKVAGSDGEPEVAGAGEREPGAGGRPVDRRDDRLLEPAEGEDVRVVVARGGAPDVAGRLLELESGPGRRRSRGRRR